jgi:hypothetical protein
MAQNRIFRTAALNYRQRTMAGTVLIRRAWPAWASWALAGSLVAAVMIFAYMAQTQ